MEALFQTFPVSASEQDADQTGFLSATMQVPRNKSAANLSHCYHRHDIRPDDHTMPL
jgi:hypothetical protein